MARKKKNKVPKTAAEKSAEAALYAAQQVGVEATRSRTRQASRGAFSQRQLRSGGTSLQQYNMAKFKSDPFPALGGNPNLGASTPSGSSPRRGPSGPRSGATSADGRNRVRQQEEAKARNRRRDNMNGPNNAEKMEAEAAAKAKAAKAKAAAAARAKKKKQQKLTDAKGGSTKALGGSAVMS